MNEKHAAVSGARPRVVSRDHVRHTAAGTKEESYERGSAGRVLPGREAVLRDRAISTVSITQIEIKKARIAAASVDMGVFPVPGWTTAARFSSSALAELG